LLYLHAPNDELRDQPVPINRKHRSKSLEACWHHLDKQNGRSITFEYVMLTASTIRQRRHSSWRNCCEVAPQK
jgi:adenine C2-methylase RlmN of 23S rRNA A2503 and tRNA A37